MLALPNSPCRVETIPNQDFPHWQRELGYCWFERMFRACIDARPRRERSPLATEQTGRDAIAAACIVEFHMARTDAGVLLSRKSAHKSSSGTLTSLYRPYTRPGPVVYRLCMPSANSSPLDERGAFTANRQPSARRRYAA